MEMNAQHKLMQHIIRLLKVSEIVIPIGRTSKGNLGLKYSYNKDDFEMIIDAVPLSTKDSLNDENNIELKKMIEKYMFEQSISQKLQQQGDRIAAETIYKGFTANPLPEPKKRGRPFGSKKK